MTKFHGAKVHFFSDIACFLQFFDLLFSIRVKKNVSLQCSFYTESYWCV